jgi:ssDNA-binding Zn-finger/Zn-ribbon topoisomerase 1
MTIDFDDGPETKPKARIFRTVNGKTTRVCPACGADMVIRVNRTTKERFLACPRYPNCTETAPLPEDVKMREAGAKPLPGME